MAGPRTALLRGGSRDGESTTLSAEVTRLLAASDAPGLLDVYQAEESATESLPDGTVATVFRFVDQQPIGDLPPEAIHMPDPR